MISVPRSLTHPHAVHPRLISPLPVQVAAADSVSQRRSTVAFRAILLIPYLINLLPYGIVVVAVSFFSWWGALFRGRLPRFAISMLISYVRWTTRFCAYMLLLTDVKPPFSGEDFPDYPVTVAIPEIQLLNRLSIIFRAAMAMPAVIVGSAIAIGAGIISIFAWLITLLTGKLPNSLHLTFTAVLRYNVRLTCYCLLLSAAYPVRIFDDKSTTLPIPVPGYGAVQGHAALPKPDHPAIYGVPETVDPESLWGILPDYPIPGRYSGVSWDFLESASWHLVAKPAAKWLVALCLLLGLFTLSYLIGGIAEFFMTQHNNYDSTADHSLSELSNSFPILMSIAQWVVELGGK